MNITLHLTNRCNLSCKYCYVNHDHPKDMTFETAKQAVDLAVQLSQNKTGISFFGGEPLLKKDLIEEIIAYCEQLAIHSSHTFSFKMVTNGILLDEAFLKYAKKKQVIAAISHDGTKYSHDMNRVDAKQNGSFNHVEEKSALLLRYQPYAMALLVINPNTVCDLYEGVLHLFEKGFKYIICSLNYSAIWKERELRLLEKQYQLLSQLYYKKSTAKEKFYLAPFDPKISAYINPQKHNENKCILGKKQVSIAPDGSIYPCFQFIGEQQFYMGDIHKGIVKDFAHLQNQKEAELSCETCAIKERCNHHCACINMQATGDIHKISPVLCAHEQMITIIADKLAEKLYKVQNEIFINKHYNDNYPFLSALEDMRDRLYQDT